MSGAIRAPALEPHDHVVNFYDHDRDIVAEVTRYVAEGIHRGEGTVVLATEAHRQAVHDGLRRSGIDVGRLRESHQYLSLDAADTLTAFMVDGEPDAERFGAVIGDLVDRASNGGRPVRAFGEMVTLLWDAGNVAGAIELESLWNDLAASRRFTLYCAYPMSSLLLGGDLVATSRICDHHSSVIAPLSYKSARSLRPVLFQDPDERSELFVPVPSAVRAVRRFVTETLLAWDEQVLLDDASLVVSELATNAVRHASSAFRASISRDGSVIRIAIDDVSSIPPRMTDPATEALGGRGVAIVDRLSARWGIDVLADGKTVWSELTRPLAER